jgi:hypothetical protein
LPSSPSVRTWKGKASSYAWSELRGIILQDIEELALERNPWALVSIVFLHGWRRMSQSHDTPPSIFSQMYFLSAADLSSINGNIWLDVITAYRNAHDNLITPGSNLCDASTQSYSTINNTEGLG